MTTVILDPATQVVITEDLAPDWETTDDPGKASHIVEVPEDQPDQTPQAYVLRASIEALTIEALCGWRWIPSRDPKSLPVCSKCLDVYQGRPGDHHDRLPDA